MAAEGAGYPYALVAHLLQADLTVGNLEGALTDLGAPWPKGYTFRTPPSFAFGLRDAGFDLVSLANNHTMDYGVEGLADTMTALDTTFVRRAGAGNSAAEAQMPVVLRANGLGVAVVACALTPDEGARFSIRQWEAVGNAPGLFVCDDGPLRAAVAAARAQADFVIVQVHAGDEYLRTPNAVQRRLATTALDAGADAFIGHHAHVVQPVEQRGNQLIAWGLGNFIFDLDPGDLANIPVPRVSLVLRITLTQGAGVTAWEALPVTLDADADRPRPATAEEAAVLQRLITP
jgi:poly-gamma-glutamate synthesis protein (capsule biosynthesis protein)